MDSQLNTTFDSIKENQKHNLVMPSKYNNFIENTNKSARTRGIPSVSTSSLSSRLNNLQQALREDFVNKQPIKEFTTLYATKKDNENEDTSPLSFKPKMRKTFNIEDEKIETDLPITPHSMGGSLYKSKYSYEDVTKTPTNSKHSRIVSPKRNCFEDDNNDDDLDEKFANSTQISSLLLKDYPLGAEKIQMNFIILMGLVMGVLISKIFEYLQICLNCLMQKVLQFRKNLMGTTSLWTFLNFEDTRRLQVRSKLFLLPVVLICSLIYSLIYILHFLVQFLLSAAPEGLIKFVQNMHK